MTLSTVMKKLLFLLTALSLPLLANISSVDVYESGTEYQQFTQADLNTANDSSQFWLAAKSISIHIGSAMDVWLSNYVNSWYGDIPALNGNEFNMARGTYGAYDVNSGKTWVGTGDTATVTFADANGKTYTTWDGQQMGTTEAYYLGHFEGGEDIVLWLTSIESNAATSTQLVNNGEFDPNTLVSRVNGTVDQAGNVRLNFGYVSDDGLVAHELIAFGSYGEFSPTGGGAVSGQPLPGVLASSLIIGGCVALVSKKRRRKNG